MFKIRHRIANRNRNRVKDKMSCSASRKQDLALAELFVGEPGAMRLDPVAPPSTAAYDLLLIHD